MYKSIIRPCLFRIDAEKIHDQIITLLHIYRHLGPIRSLTRSLFHPKAVPFQWQNLNFSNRVGLSAGFDKEANCFDELSDLLRIYRSGNGYTTQSRWKSFSTYIPVT